jgi:hypothetical protein
MSFAFSALLVTTSFASPADQWTGKYTCVTDDTSEVYDGDRTQGTELFDYDGDHSDPSTTFGVEVRSDVVVAQSVFGNVATNNWVSFTPLKSINQQRQVALLASAVERITDRIVVLTLVRDQRTGKVGFFMTKNSYSTPIARGGESFAMTDIVLGHCTKR